MFATILVVLALLIAGIGTAWWALRSESGTTRLLALVPYLKVEGAQGALFGDFQARRLDVTVPGAPTLVLRDVGWRGLTISRTPNAGQWLHIRLDDLHASRVDVTLPPSTASTAAPQAPTSLELPVELEIAALRVDALHVGTAPPVRDLRAQLHLGADGGARHRIDGLSLAWDQLTARGAIDLGARTPFALTARADVAQVAGPATQWRASTTLSGNLIEPSIVANLRARADATRPEQSLDLRATLRPFAAWPLKELSASTQALDLSALLSSAPVTSLSGAAYAATTAIDQPGAVGVRLVNAEPGRWDEHRLPVRDVTLAVSGRPNDQRVIDLASLQVALGTKRDVAGTLSGTGRYTPERATLDLKLAAVTPSLMDARAPQMRLSGPLSLDAQGLAGTAPSVAVKADITGPLADRGPARNVQLKLDATAAAARIDIRELRAAAGGAEARVSGTATHAGDRAPWAVKGTLGLVDFDPVPWWPGADNAAWARGPHKLNARGAVDLSIATAADTADLWQRLAGVRGKADVDIVNSQLAGVPLAGRVELRSNDGRALSGVLKFDADGNSMVADVHLALDAKGASDRWDVSLAAPALGRLTPLYRLLKPAGGGIAGSATGTARLNGRWPSLSTQGRLEANALRVDAMSVERANADWQVDLVPNGKLDIQAALAQAGATAPDAAGKPVRRVIDSANFSVKGTTRDHRIELRAESQALPPAWTDALVAQATSVASAASAPAPAASVPAATAPARSVAVLRAQGGAIENAGQVEGWRGNVNQLELRPTQATLAPWLRLRDVAIAAAWGPTPAVDVQPGRAEVLGGALRWSRLAWRGATATQPAQLDAQAQIEPLRIAPVLARLQPDFGWRGDLTIAGRIDVRSTPAFTADIVVERQSGDLSVTDEAGTQALGLSDLRFGLNARDGTWSFTQALAGSTLGVAAGAIVVRTTPDAIWPPADAPLQGVLELRVANLGTWGTWVPTGWRLAGELRTSATLSGSFGAPQYLGSVVGQGLGVRNFLQGVDVREGDLSIVLQGTTARIEKFSAKAGTGTVTLEGGATLGAAPKADLRLTAARFQLLGRVDRRIVTTGQARLQLDADSIGLDGKFEVDEGLIDFTRSEAPTLSEDVEVVRRKEPSPAAVQEAQAKAAVTPPPTRRVAIDLQVGLGRQLRLRGRGLDTGLRGDLRITAPQGRMAVNGTIETADGTYNAYSQKLTIDRGLLAFSGAVDNPRLDIQATRPGLDITVGVLVTGNAVNPRIRLFSNPNYSDVDKLSWLVLGRASDTANRTDTALLQRAALALLSGDSPSKTEQFTKSIGLDELSLKQGSGEVRDTVVSLGKQISRQWYVGYERGLSTTTGNWQLIYRLGKRFTLRAQSGTDSSVDAIWSWRWGG